MNTLLLRRRMRTSKLVVAFGAGLLGSLQLSACANSANDCTRIGTCVYGTRATGSGGADPTCVPSTNASAVDSTCGIFASSSAGDDTNAGTKDAPVKTLAKALELAKAASAPVYACAETFEEAVTAHAGSVIYGGLSCTSGWLYVGDSKKTSIAPLGDPATVSSIALTLSGGADKTHIEDVAVTAPDAMQEGGSSIAALVNGGAVDLVRCDLVAGNGMKGAPGATPSDPIGPNDPNDPAIKGMDGVVACTGNPLAGNPGGNGTTNALCMTSVGGIGGTGREAMGEAGTDGTPLPDPNPDQWGLGGIGATVGSCKGGEDGFLGVDGAPGAGALTSSEGSLSSTGFVGAPGEAGADGSPGQGGGGGGAAKGKLNCNGASGGGGGAGGCGGKGGLGGQSGGASIALASVSATVTLKEVNLSSAAGGDGGDGGDGQNGAPGGVGGLGGAPVAGTQGACSGGQGGYGGLGGKGGGGRGGPSVGIAYTGTPPVMDGGGFPVLGQPGKGGAGADVSKDGAVGTKAETLDLSKGS